MIGKVRVFQVCKAHEYDPVMVDQKPVTKLRVTPVLQGMSSKDSHDKIESMVKVRCRKCGRVTWLPKAAVFQDRAAESVSDAVKRLAALGEMSTPPQIA